MHTCPISIYLLLLPIVLSYYFFSHYSRSDHILLLDNGIRATDSSQQWLEQFPARKKTTAKSESNELRINDISKSQQLRLEDENEALLQTMNSDQFYLLQFPSYCLM